MKIRTDEETKIKHLVADNSGDETLCGMGIGWTINGDEPVKEKYQTTCLTCQEVVRDIKKLKANA